MASSLFVVGVAQSFLTSSMTLGKAAEPPGRSALGLTQSLAFTVVFATAGFSPPLSWVVLPVLSVAWVCAPWLEALRSPRVWSKPLHRLPTCLCCSPFPATSWFLVLAQEEGGFGSALRHVQDAPRRDLSPNDSLLGFRKRRFPRPGPGRYQFPCAAGAREERDEARRRDAQQDLLHPGGDHAGDGRGGEDGQLEVENWSIFPGAAAEVADSSAG